MTCRTWLPTLSLSTVQVCALLLSPEQPHPARADASGSMPLWLAASQGHADVCSLLLSRAQPHPARAAEHSSIVLLQAAKAGHAEVSKVALQCTAPLAVTL